MEGKKLSEQERAELGNHFHSIFKDGEKVEFANLQKILLEKGFDIKMNSDASQVFKSFLKKHQIKRFRKQYWMAKTSTTEVLPFEMLQRRGEELKKTFDYRLEQYISKYKPLISDQKLSRDIYVEVEAQFENIESDCLKQLQVIKREFLQNLKKSEAGPDSRKQLPVSSGEESAVVEVAPKRTGRKSALSTPVSLKKIPARTSTRKTPVPPIIIEISSDSGSDTKSVPTPDSTSGRKARTPRGKANSADDSQQAHAGPKTPKSVHFSDDIESSEDSAIRKSPKNMQYSVGMDITEDLDVYSPDVKVSKTTPRRKTSVLSRAMDSFADMDLTPDITRGRSKRKTIAGSTLDEPVAPSPKRLKMGRRSNTMPSSSGDDEPMDSNLSASDEATEQEHYSTWMPLSDISGSVPSQPGIYELKVAAAKKPAYIGGCESLRQKLTLHKLKQSSGHKHLDKFIDRNLSNILVRYEQLPSAAVAKSEEKIRVKAFVDRFKNTPSYN